MRRGWSFLAILVLVVAITPPASAHNISSDVTAKFPYFTGSRARFDTTHKITGCVNNGDGQTCGQGVDFRAESSCQINIGGNWANCSDSALSGVRHWPDDTAVTAVFWVTCSGSGDVTVRTRGWGWLKHGGNWYRSPPSYSSRRTIACA
jgi:hypothetical protein